MQNSTSQLRPDFTGIWRANLHKSILRGPIPNGIVQRIEHREPLLDQELLVAQPSGSEQRLIFSYNTTGEQTNNSLNGRTVRTCARWDGAELVIESWLETLHFRDRWSLSDDGETLTMAHRDGDLAGQIVVHERAPAPEKTGDSRPSAHLPAPRFSKTALNTGSASVGK
jgi:hypothetical protein